MRKATDHSIICYDLQYVRAEKAQKAVDHFICYDLEYVRAEQVWDKRL